MNREELLELANQLDVPATTAVGLVNYILEGIPSGHFLEAVLSNDLMKAMSRADFTNRRFLHNTCIFLFNHAPARCYGTPRIYKEWVEAGGWVGVEKQEAEVEE